MIPSWLKKQLPEDALPRIRQAIHNAEQHTSAEIVPMLCRISTPMHHVLPLLWCGSLLVWSVVFFTLEGSLHMPIWAWFLAFILASLTTALLHRIPFVQRGCTHPDMMNESVDRRAELEFFRAGLDHTQHRTGVLIFASLLEHRAVILADSAIADRLPSETWREAVNILVSEIKSGNLERGYIRCIAFCAEKLRENFPVQPHDQNELRNEFIILSDSCATSNRHPERSRHPELSEGSPSS